MKRTIFYLFCIWGLTVSSAVAQKRTVSHETGTFVGESSAERPERRVSVSPDGVTVTYEFKHAVVLSDPDVADYYLWRISGFGHSVVPGEPDVPVRWDSFALPEGCASFTVSVLESACVDVPLRLSPARAPQPEGKESPAVVPDIAPYEGWFPREVVETGEVRVYRGRSVAEVGVYPVRYDWKNGVVRACSKIVYRVTFGEGGLRSAPEGRIAPDDSFLDNTTLNGNVGAAGYEMFRSAGDTGSAGKDYLILSTPEFEEAVRRLADWKRTLGFGVHTRLRGDWTPERIKSAVKEVYRSAPSLYYLLIVGDHDDVPAEDMARTIVNNKGYAFDYRYVTDYYYGCVDGEGDVLADLYRGRLPVSTAMEAVTVVDKIIRYERNPVRDAAFYDMGLHCAYFEDCFPDGTDGPGDGIEDKRFTLTSEEVRNYMLSKGKTVNRVYFAYDYNYSETDNYPPPTFWNKGEFAWGDSIPVELQRPYFAWDGDSADIVRYIDEGAFYVLYRGHGTDSTWVQPHFTGDNILSLANGDRLPVVFSINCETGSFQEDDCFAEVFLRKKGGGAVAVYAATEKSWPGYNDAMVIGMFDAIWPDPGVDSKLYNFLGMTTSPSRLRETTRLGEILDQGLRRMEETWGQSWKGNSISTQFTREIFHCFGDPGMRIYTDTPTEFKKLSITCDVYKVRVDLGSEAGDIAFYDKLTEEIRFYTGRSAEYSGDPRHVRVCVSGHNKIPFIGYPVCPDTYYIQNEIVQGSKHYKSDVIRAGSQVTDDKPSGEVVFDGGEIKVSGHRLILDRGTTIKPGTKFEVQPKK
ncbi:C25 family cysteine peptidase [Barnesiella intestinihominis]|uniref:C25 family cysteine peptidase n=3 Tax=Barnesiella intestinihominis TaxID=487174 RepID=UPI00189EF013|nr:C25 family cysteine peptidase [Barnesiella intestinihominis]MDB0672552.1 C25 family cysteine peptidase [Barnesiella intestinihominis]